MTTYIKERGRLWIIKTPDTGEPLDAADIQFIREFDPVIYWSDANLYHWAFDTKLPSGRWLENIQFEDGLKTAKAIVL